MLSVERPSERVKILDGALRRADGGIQSEIISSGKRSEKADLAALPTGLLYVKGDGAWMKDNFFRDCNSDRGGTLGRACRRAMGRSRARNYNGLTATLRNLTT